MSFRSWQHSVLYRMVLQDSRQSFIKLNYEYYVQNNTIIIFNFIHLNIGRDIRSGIEL